MYVQIANVLRAQIVDDTDLHRRLPSEQELAQTYGVARGTIQSALDLLADEGLIVRSPKRPTVSNPNGIRAYLKKRQRRAIVVLAYDSMRAEIPRDSYYGQIYQGVLTAGEQAGYRCVLRQVKGSMPQSRPVLVPDGVDEVLGIITMAAPNPILTAVQGEAGLPVVYVDHWPIEPGTDGVVVDCFAEAHLAVDFLIANGHRELFYVGNMIQRGMPAHAERDAVLMEAGYRNAASAAGLATSANRVYFCPQQPLEMGFLADWVVNQHPRPTAGLVFNVGTMLYLAGELTRRKIRCPEDVSLMCKTYHSMPTDVASIQCDPLHLGASAVELLLRRTADKTRPGMRLSLESKLKRGPTVRCLLR